MKYIKTYESFQVNEEISLKGIAPIIASLFLTFNSLDVKAFPAHGAGRSVADVWVPKIETQARKIKIDLEKLKSETNDPQLLDLISSVQSLESFDYGKWGEGVSEVDEVLNKIKSYISSHEINDPLIEDSLNHISSGDIKILKNDYEELLKRYDGMRWEDNFSTSMLIIVSLIIVILFGLVGYQYLRDGYL